MKRPGASSTLAIKHPDFLDAENDLYVGLFGRQYAERSKKDAVNQRVFGDSLDDSNESQCRRQVAGRAEIQPVDDRNRWAEVHPT